MYSNPIYLHPVNINNTNVMYLRTDVNSKKTLKMIETDKKLYKGFRKGLDQVPSGKLVEAKKKIWKALDVKNRQSFYAYRDGITEPKFTKAEALKAIFLEYGITEIWD